MEQKTRVGVTASRRGITQAQAAGFSRLLGVAEWLHHGDCVGGDASAHQIARRNGIKVHLHPPTITSLRAFCDYDITEEPKAYLDRNKDIVDTAHYMIAMPSSENQNSSGGTWHTIRYAWKKNRHIYIIHFDGRVEEFS